jgi:hypothetical protein
MDSLEEWKAVAEDYPDPEHFKVNINLAWGEMNDYYTKLDETPAYYTSAILKSLVRGISRIRGPTKHSSRGFRRQKEWSGTCGKQSRNRYHFLQYLAKSLRISV